MSQPNKEVLEKYAEFQFDTIRSDLQRLAQSTLATFSEDSAISALQGSEELHRQVESLRRKLSEIQQVINSETQCPQSPNSYPGSSPSVLTSAIQSLKELQESTNMIMQKIKACMPKEKISEDCKVNIARFYCKKGQEKEKPNWVLNVINQTKDSFRKVEFFILEDQQKIAEIRLIEPEIDIKKFIGHLENDDIYGKHLIAKVDNAPVSELFPIMKVEFKDAGELDEEEIEKPYQGKRVIRYTILNSCPETLDGLYVFCDETNEKYYAEKKLEYGETCDILVPFEGLDAMNLRVMRENEIMSIAYALNLKEEEEKSSEEEMGNGDNHSRENGLAFSNPFPQLRHPVVDPAVEKVNQQLATLEKEKIVLSEMLKAYYPGIESKMQLYKAVSRYDTFEDCVDYLIDAGIIQQE